MLFRSNLYPEHLPFVRRSIVHWKAPGTSGRICHGRNCYGSVYDRTGCIWKHSPRTHPSCSSGCGPPSLPVWHWDYISPGTWGKTAAGHPGQLDYLPSLQTSMLLLSNVSNGLLIPMRAPKAGFYDECPCVFAANGAN